MQTVSKRFYSLTEVLGWIAYLGLAAIVLVVFVDVSGRKFLNRPLTGSNELTELIMLSFGGFAIMYTAVKRGHIAVDLLLTRFPRRIQILTQIIASLLGFGTWALLANRVLMYGLEDLKQSTTTVLLGIRTWPFLLALALAAFMTCLTLLIEAFYPKVSDEKPEEKKMEQSQ